MQTFLLLSLFLLVGGIESTPTAFSDLPFPRSHDPGAICGVLCAERAMFALGIKNLSLDELICEDYISSDKGSTIDDLEKLILDKGAFPVARSGMGVGLLESLHSPAILHVKADLDATNFQHWILYLGAEGGRYKIADLPGEAFTISAAELQSLWDGNLIIVTERKRGELEVFFAWAVHQALPLLSVLFVCIAVATVICAGRRHLVDLSSWRGACLICVASLSFCLMRHLVFSDGFLREHAMIERILAEQILNNAEFNRDSLESAAEKEKLFMIDARMPRDFLKGHVSYAVNIPTFASYSERHSITSMIDKKSMLVVYCQSERCPYSDIVAAKLRRDGFMNVIVYRPGWVDLESR